MYSLPEQAPDDAHPAGSPTNSRVSIPHVISTTNNNLSLLLQLYSILESVPQTINAQNFMESMSQL